MNMNTTPVRRVLCGAAFLCAIVGASADVSPEAAKIIDRSIEAAGGKERLESIEAIRMVGTMNMPAMGMTMTMTSLQVYPDKGYFEQEVPGMGKMVQAFDGDSGWAKDPMQGFRHLSPEEIKAQKQNRSIREMLDYQKLFESAEVLDDVEGMKVVKIKLADSGLEETHYYSKESGHLERMEMMADMGPQGSVPATMAVIGRTEENGLVFPSKLEMNAAGMKMLMDFSSIEVNPEVDENLFAPPQ